MLGKDRHLRMKLNDVNSDSFATLVPAFSIFICWTDLEGKFPSDEVYEIRVSSLGDLFFSLLNAVMCCIVLLLVRTSGMKFSVIETEN